jgi:hypothetical protein
MIRGVGRGDWKPAVRRATGVIVLAMLLGVRVSAACASASPIIQSESVSKITSTDATLEAEIDPHGAEAGVFYQFQLLLDPGEASTELACPSSPPPGYSTCVGPQDPTALPLKSLCGECEDELAAVPVSLDLSSAGVTLEPGRTYYFRVLAADRKFSEDTAEWEPPAVVGVSKKFTTPPIGAQPISLTFTEDRANVGVQLSDAPMFTAPDVAPFTGQIDPGTGSITAGELQVPEFFTHVTGLYEGDVSVDFKIGVIEGSFKQATGALSLEGEAGGTLASKGKECTVITDPAVLTLTTAGKDGVANSRSGAPFTAGLTGTGAIAGQWTDMHAAPIGGDTTFCENVENRIGGSGGIWLAQEGDVVPPSAPQLTSTDPVSPGSSGTPRIRGTAEAGSTVSVYAGASCTGAPIASASAAELSSPGIAVQVGEGATAAFSATATDAAGNTSTCSAPISYTHAKPQRCVVPNVVGKKLKAAKRQIRAAGCEVGKVTGPKARKGKRRGPLVVKHSNPPAGRTVGLGTKVHLKLGQTSR